MSAHAGKSAFIHTEVFFGTNRNTCMLLDDVELQVMPTPAFTGTPTSGTVPLAVTFTDTSTAGDGTITNRHWVFGDGATLDTTDTTVAAAPVATASPPPPATHDAGGMALALLDHAGGIPDAMPQAWRRCLGNVSERVPPESLLGMLRSDPIRLAPGTTTEVRFALCWHFIQLGTLLDKKLLQRDNQRNHYAKTYTNAGAVAVDLARRHAQ